MSTRPGIRSLARGAVLALAAAMAFATFGCQQATDSDSDPDEEQVVEAALPLAPSGVGDEHADGNGSLPSRGTEQAEGEDSGEPEPQPWLGCNSSNPPGPNPVDPSTKSTAVAPNGHH